MYKVKIVQIYGTCAKYLRAGIRGINLVLFGMQSWPAEISSALALEEFFDEISRLVDQARRNVFSDDLNLLEYFRRKVQDTLNVLNVVISRCEDVNALQSFTQELTALMDSIVALDEHLWEAMETDEEYVMALN